MVSLSSATKPWENTAINCRQLKHLLTNYFLLQKLVLHILILSKQSLVDFMSNAGLIVIHSLAWGSQQQGEISEYRDIIPVYQHTIIIFNILRVLLYMLYCYIYMYIVYVLYTCAWEIFINNIITIFISILPPEISPESRIRRKSMSCFMHLHMHLC